MTRRYRTEQQRIVRRTLCVSMVCDLCGKESDNPVNEAFGSRLIEQAVIRWKWSADGDYYEGYIDLCDGCLEKVLDMVNQIRAERKLDPMTKIDWEIVTDEQKTEKERGVQ